MQKKNLLKIILAAGVLMATGLAMAANNYVALGTISSSINDTVAELATVLIDISLIAGIGFIIAAFFKFHQHKQNPTQVQMSQGVSLLLIGCGLTLIPLLIPTASVAVMGTAAKSPAKIGGSSIHDLIGTAGGKG